MSEYIKREDAIAEIAEFLMGEALLDSAYASDNIEDWKEIAVAILENIPTSDVVERKRGEWIDIDHYWENNQWVYEMKCSVCNVRIKNPYEPRFCPDCGSDMRGTDDDI